MEITLTGYPHEKQKDFFLATSRHVAYGGSRGGGKSWAMRRKFILLALNYSNLRLLLLRRTLPELRENHILPLLAEIGKIAKYNDTEKAFVFPNGSRIKLGYCDAEKDVYQYQGQEYDVIGLEEATHFTENQKDFLTTCNRSVRTDFKPRMYYTANPGNVGHQWFKRLFIDKEYRGTERPDDYVFIPAKVYDNEVLMKNNPEYLQTLQNLPEDLRKAHLDGDWNVFAGQYFREFRPEKDGGEWHVVTPFTIPDYWKRFRSIDWGYKDPSAVYWHAVSPEGRVITYKELYINETIASELADKIVQLSKGENISYMVASPDMWARRGSGVRVGESIADTFQQKGIRLLRADNNRVVGWQRMREFLAIGPDGKPWWQIFSSCQNLVRTLPGLIFDEHDKEDVADNCEDHAPESCRYALMSRPRPNAEPQNKITGTYAWAELQMMGYKEHQIRKMVRNGDVRIIGKKEKRRR